MVYNYDVANRSGSEFDDKDDEILRMVNDHQKDLVTKDRSREPQSITEEEKLDLEEPEKDLFAQFFTSAFQPNVEASAEKHGRAKPQVSLSLKSKAFGSPTTAWPQQPNQERDRVPPGLNNNSYYENSSPNAIFPKQRDQPRLLGYSNSFNQIPRVMTPVSATNQPTRFGTQDSPLKPGGMLPKGISHFHSMNNIPTNFGPSFHQILNPQPPSIARTDSRSSFDPRNGSQTEAPLSAELGGTAGSHFGGLGYENLVEMIEQDIIVRQ